jgi:hypothetical protein
LGTSNYASVIVSWIAALILVTVRPNHPRLATYSTTAAVFTPKMTKNYYSLRPIILFAIWMYLDIF